MKPPDLMETHARAGETVDPRIQARRVEVQREVGRRRRRWTLVVASVGVSIGLVYLGIQSPMLDVDHVRVTGTANLDDDAVITAAGVEIGEPMLWVDIAKLRERVATLPWVATVRVQRDLPGTLRIIVEEEDPVAFAARGDATFALFAADGRVIANVEKPPHGAVEVRGVRKVPAIERKLSPPDAPGVVRVLPARLANQVVAVDVGGEGVALDLARGGEIRLGSLDDLDAKAAAALAVLEQWGAEPLTYIDVSVPQTPTAR